jgi:hypothetical protein
MEDLQKVQLSLKNRFSSLMAGLLNLALKKGEDKISWIITVEYEILLEEEMIIKGISGDKYLWLFYLWVS